MIEGNFAELFAAIYKKAVKDDCLAVQGRSVRGVIARGANALEAKRYVQQQETYIEKRIREAVYKESEDWGSGESVAVQQGNIVAIVEEVVDGYEIEVSKADKQATGRKRKVANKS